MMTAQTAYDYEFPWYRRMIHCLLGYVPADELALAQLKLAGAILKEAELLLEMAHIVLEKAEAQFQKSLDIPSDV